MGNRTQDMTLAGVIVTYNRYDELIKNIAKLSSQKKRLDKLYIIDNHGTDNTYDKLMATGVMDDESIEYIYLDDNIGGAGGFYEGIKRAYVDGYDFIYLMDDDGRPVNDRTVEIIYERAKKLYVDHNNLFVNSLVVGDEDECVELSFCLGNAVTRREAEEYAHDYLIEGNANPFNGTLISRELVDTIGYPNKDFFIRGDEVDYMTRAIDADAYVATVVDSLYFHPKTEKKYIRILWKKCMTSVTGAPWKLYYSTRNLVYSLKANNRSKSIFKAMVVIVCTILRYEKHKLKCMKMVFKGYRDGKKGKLGRNDFIKK